MLDARRSSEITHVGIGYIKSASTGIHEGVLGFRVWSLGGSKTP